MTNEQQIEPCPFCGGKPESFMGGSAYRCACIAKNSGWFSLADWNRRHDAAYRQEKEARERAEAALASLADAFNTECRENYGDDLQVKLFEDMRRPLQKLVERIRGTDRTEKAREESRYFQDRLRKAEADSAALASALKAVCEHAVAYICRPGQTEPTHDKIKRELERSLRDALTKAQALTGAAPASPKQDAVKED